MTSTQSMISRIDEFRGEGRFDEALEIARELLDQRRHAPGTRPYELGDAERLVATLERVTSLPAEARRELAHADHMKPEIERLCTRQHYKEVPPIAEAQLRIREHWLGRAHVDACTTLDYLSNAYNDLGRFEEAERAARETLATRRDVLEDDHPELADSASNLGMVLRDRGAREEAIPHFREAAMRYRRTLGDHACTSLALRSLAECLYGCGRDAEAEAPMWEALAVARRVFGAEHAAVAGVLDHASSMYQRQGAWQHAKELALEAVRILEKDPYRRPTVYGRALSALGTIATVEKDIEAAREWSGRAVEFAREFHADDSPQVDARLLNRAFALASFGDPGAEAAAVEGLERRTRRLGPDAHDLEYPHYILGLVYIGAGEVEVAEHHLHRAITCAGEDAYARCRALIALSDLCIGAHRFAESRELLHDQARSYEARRAGLRPGISRATMAQEPYSRLAYLDLARGDGSSAWSFAERAVGRVTADLIFVPERGKMTAEELAREEGFRRRQRAIESQHVALLERDGEAPERAAEMRRLEDALIEARHAHARLLAEVHSRDGTSFNERYNRASVQASLDPGTAIIGWIELELCGGERVVRGYVLRDVGDVFWAEISSEQADTPLYAAIERRGASALGLTGADAPPAHAHEWWRLRLAPLLPALNGVERLVIVAPGAMAFTPIEALVDDGGQFADDRIVCSYTPSATILTHLRETAGARELRRALLVADPPYREEHRNAVASTQREEELRSFVSREARAVDRAMLASLPRLSGTREEIARIARFFPEHLALVGSEATEQSLVELADGGRLREFDVLHFATHALVDERIPERSALVFSQLDLPDALDAVLSGRRAFRGLVTAGEIARDWRLGAELVTLSACRTGRGPDVRGEGLVSFAHAFLVAGARSVLVSLWPVDDRATSLLMSRFYEEWLTTADTSRRGKAAALRDAKRWLRTHRDQEGRRPYRHPFYWAPFVLFGDPW